MKWFKHISDSLNDPDVSELIERFGGDGYLVFFGTFELMAKEYDVDNPGISTFSWKFLKKNLQISVKKISKIFHFLSEKPEKNRRFWCDYRDDDVTIKCPELKKLCDEWTKKNSRQNSGATPEKLPPIEEEVEEEREEEKKNKEIPPYIPPPSGSAADESAVVNVKHIDELMKEISFLKSEVEGFKQKKKRQITISFSDDDLKMAELLRDLLTANDPNRKKESPEALKGWANECRLMREQDKRTIAGIEQVIRWAQKDTFWREPIRSMKTVRKHFDTISLKQKRIKEPAKQVLNSSDIIPIR